MPTERIAMRKVREILRLTYDAGLPSREVGRQVGVGSTGVRVMLQRFRASKLEWPLPEELTDTALEAELYGVAATRGGQRDRPEPDWAAVHRELSGFVRWCAISIRRRSRFPSAPASYPMPESWGGPLRC